MEIEHKGVIFRPIKKKQRGEQRLTMKVCKSSSSIGVSVPMAKMLGTNYWECLVSEDGKKIAIVNPAQGDRHGKMSCNGKSFNCPDLARLLKKGVKYIFEDQDGMLVCDLTKGEQE